MKNIILACLCAVSLHAISQRASAVVLLSYTFTGAVTEGTATPEVGTVFDPSSLASGFTASPLTDGGAGIRIMSSTAATAPASAPFLRTEPGVPPTAATDLLGAVTVGSYFTFTLTGTGGNLMNLTSLTFDAMRGGAGTPRGYGVRSSVDGFTANLSTADIPTVRPTTTPIAVDLSGAPFQGLSTITFRVYSYSPANGSSVDYDNFVLNGTAIPEPGAGALAVGAMVGLMARRRRNI